MFRLPNVPSAEDLIETAFSRGADRAKEQRSTKKDWRDVRMRRSEEERVKTVGAVVRGDLKAIIKHFPSYDQMPVFYRRLLDIRVSKDRYKKSLGAVQWCADRVQKAESKALYSIKSTRTTSSHMKEFLGRSASYIKQISGDLAELAEIKRIISGFPLIEDVPTLVIAGYPNVGKSTFLRNLTGSEVKVAAYPFTTQEILIGHANIRYIRHQIIDTPGLLDRPMEERNEIEQQAILAIEELADAILFIFDPTQSAEEQVGLLENIREAFQTPLTVVVNKSDNVDPKALSDAVRKLGVSQDDVISSLRKEDCRRIFERIFKQMKAAAVEEQ